MRSNTDPGVVIRGEVSELFGQMYDGDRDIWDVMGYDEEITPNMYRARFRRGDIGARIVKKPADDTWKFSPTITTGDEESEFDNAVKELNQTRRLFHYCHRVDVTAGIGEYGLLFIGFADGQPLSEPVNEGSLSDPEDIAYFSPFSQDLVVDWTLGKETDIDPSDRMYNRPVEYEIDFSDIDGDPSEEDIEVVHHSRIVHVAEGLVESDLKGTPRQRNCWNRLLDRDKVIGASAEMFYTGADRKFHFNIDSDNAADIPDDALDDLDEEVQKLVHDLQHYIKTFNTDLNVLSGEEIDPSGVHDVLMKSIAASTGIPRRILEGSERGELASTQDRANWFGKIHNRQNTYAEYQILRPLIDKLIEYGILPDPGEDGYVIEWENLFELNDLDKAEVMKTRADAIDSLAPGGNTDVVATMGQLVDFVLEGEMFEVEDENFDIDTNEMSEFWENKRYD